jgi:hypothetical protein
MPRFDHETSRSVNATLAGIGAARRLGGAPRRVRREAPQHLGEVDVVAVLVVAAAVGPSAQVGFRSAGSPVS